jgi:hypothetical protein
MIANTQRITSPTSSTLANNPTDCGMPNITVCAARRPGTEREMHPAIKERVKAVLRMASL